MGVNPEMVAEIPATLAVTLFPLRETDTDTDLPSTMALASPRFTCGVLGDGIVDVDGTTSVVDVELTDLPPATANVVDVERFDLGIVATDACPCATDEVVVDAPV